MVKATPRRLRVLTSLIAGLLMVLLAAGSVAASVHWSKPDRVGPQYSWNLGRGLAMTETSSTTYLHAQFEDDGHSHTGIYYRRGSASGSSWGTAKRLNPTNKDAERGAIAAAGKYVYVAYTTGSHGANDYDPAASRLVGLRVNTSHGSSSAWLPGTTFSADTRVGRPALAAAGFHVYVVYTDADTGDIVVLTNGIKLEGSATSGARAGGIQPQDTLWSASTAGVTTRSSTIEGDGFEGSPVIAASGANVLVAWVDTDDGTIKAKISTDHGQTWPDTATDLAIGQAYGLSAAGDDTRLAIAWAQPDGIRARVNKTGSWGPSRALAGFSSTGTYRNGYGTSIALAGSSRLGVAWSACTRANCAGSSTQGVNVRWRESANNGSSWESPVTIASHGAGGDRRINDFPSALMPDARHRLVTYNTASRDFSTYRLVIEAGNGKP